MQTSGSTQARVRDKKPRSAWRIARWGVYLIAIIIVVQMLRKPAPIATPPDPRTRAQLAQQFEQKMSDLESARGRGATGAEAQFSSEEISAAFVDDSGAPAPAVPQNVAGSEAQQLPEAKNAQVVFESDSVIAQFTTNLYGKDIVFTFRAHLRAEDGYLKIEPTECKLGELPLPLSMADSVVRRKLSEPEMREKLKLPEWVADVRVEGGQLVVKEK